MHVIVHRMISKNKFSRQNDLYKSPHTLAHITWIQCMKQTMDSLTFCKSEGLLGTRFFEANIESLWDEATGFLFMQNQLPQSFSVWFTQFNSSEEWQMLLHNWTVQEFYHFNLLTPSMQSLTNSAFALGSGIFSLIQIVQLYFIPFRYTYFYIVC